MFSSEFYEIFKNTFSYTTPLVAAFEETLKEQSCPITNIHLEWCIELTLNANPAKWSNTLKQFVGKLPTNCLSVFDHFVI